MRQPGPSVCALCELVALLSKNRTCARPHCNAMPSEHFLHTSHGTLHTLHFMLHTCASQSTLHFISNHLSYSHLMSPHLSSSHLIPSLLTCHLSKFFSTVFISSEHWEKFISTHLRSSARKKALPVRGEIFCTKKHKAHKALAHRRLRHRCIYKENLDNILCTTKLAQSTSQYYFVLRSLHKELPSTTLYYKACTQRVPVLLCTTKLAQSTSQYYVVPQSLHKVPPSTTS